MSSPSNRSLSGSLHGDSMDCFLTYNFSCVNSTFAQFNSSAPVFGHGGSDDRSTLDLVSSANRSIPASIFVSTQHVVITALILGAIIVFTIAGNILVIAAVKLEKNLHSVAYYLFVSLAVADLMIASLVSDDEQSCEHAQVSPTSTSTTTGCIRMLMSFLQTRLNCKSSLGSQTDFVVARKSRLTRALLCK